MTINEEKTLEEVRKNEKENQLLYVIYDRIADEYCEPKMFINSGCALRWFNELMSKTQFPADDFEFLQVGEMDVNRGLLVAFEKPVFIQRGNAKEI